MSEASETPSRRRAAGAAKRAGIAAISLVVAGLAVGACDTPVRIHGHINDPESVAALQTGVHSEDDVLTLLGTPSTVSTFDESKWYYIGEKSTKFAFQRPETLERSVLVVSFDEQGLVEETVTYDLTDGREVDPVGRITPTEGRDFTIMQQILGNIGRLPGSGGQPVELPGP